MSPIDHAAPCFDPGLALAPVLAAYAWRGEKRASAACWQLMTATMHHSRLTLRAITAYMPDVGARCCQTVLPHPPAGVLLLLCQARKHQHAKHDTFAYIIHVCLRFGWPRIDDVGAPLLGWRQIHCKNIDDAKNLVSFLQLSPYSMISRFVSDTQDDNHHVLVTM
jgi:hypothetical protein